MKHSVCAYCGDSIIRVEIDHAPVPKRLGGVHHVTSCVRCHDLKDRIPFLRWPEELQVKALEMCNQELPWPVNIVVDKMFRMLCDHELIKDVS